MAFSPLAHANHKYLVRHKGRAIHIYQYAIPGYYGIISDEVLELAAEKAYKRGWRKIVLTWADMACSVCFEDGYVHLLALNPSMARGSGSHYEWKEHLCKMNDVGEVYAPPPPRSPEDDDFNPWDF
jgi:hypothetical protein